MTVLLALDSSTETMALALQSPAGSAFFEAAGGPQASARLVPEALSHVAPAGTVVCAGIHMTDIPSFPYRLLWEERTVRSVANLTRRDAEEFLALVPAAGVQTHVEPFALEDANRALAALRDGHLTGAAVLEVSTPSA